MSKYITHFQTEAAYQAALPTLDLPNVSLVDELGEVHYHRALYGAHAGDIALYDVAEAQKIVVTAADWNLTSYPTASYPIIGVVVADETAAGCKVMSTFLVGTDGTPSTTNTFYKWQNQTFDWPSTSEYNTVSDAENDLNGKTNTAAIITDIKNYDLSYSTDNITGNIGDVIQKYHVTGTLAGDWYIPAFGEVKQIYNNRTVIKDTFNKINQADSNIGLSGNTLINGDYVWTSSRKDTIVNVWRRSLNDTGSNGYSQNVSAPIRPLTII